MPSVFPRSSVPVKRERSHSPALTDASASREMADEGEQEGDRVLSRGDRVAGGRIDDHHAGPRRGIDVDPVDPDARHADHAQARRGRGEQLGVDPRLRAHDQRVPPAALAEQLQQLVAGVPDADLGVVRAREVIDRGLGHRLDHEDACHRWHRV